ncbi:MULTISPECIES: SecY-interacting protein [Pseudoalteromonas]|uniref:SecY-interacting protein n=1 Tax=Pseudoalteromonas amylolytica TaxID=1859457 RepID=A0A1S1MQZ4_9GAMM|nr:MULTISPECIES: SecY-interacting protein [Pseudoalteromonas]MCF6436353.1 SecY-interacting protein [Pseudoalteromonas sp. MMG022]OHU86726.1 SecY-interacting protein [Pseudoalteromonas sp. JW3]OHU88749.1 SecY-interacting protein [Pseudoalteromonas amylolytica]
MAIKQILSQLHENFSAHYQHAHQSLPCMYYDPQWPSPCEVGDPIDNERIQWQASAQPDTNNLQQLAVALECTFPDELDEYYSTFFAGNVVAKVDGHQIELLQAWNQEDYERLQQNITGHVLMKRKLKQEETVFIGLTEQDDLLLCVKLNSGEVCLEYVGKPPHHVLAPSLAEFLQQVRF